MSVEMLEAWFAKYRHQPRDLVIAGRVFGGRHGESMQLPRAFTLQGRELKMHLGTTEELVIVDPLDLRQGKQGELTIREASQVVFAWHYYGRPATAENRCVETYDVRGSHVHLVRTGPCMPGEETFALPQGCIVELR